MSHCSDEQHKLVATVIEPILEKMHDFIIGQEDPITHIVMGLFTGGQAGINPITRRASLSCGHILLIGPTGTGKTEACKLLATLVGGKHERVQGTSDLLASDITGYEFPTLNSSEEKFKFRKGPIFCNILLIDECNRINPKGTSAFLEGMAEGVSTSGGKTRILKEPFLCLATMNPSEQEGTYPMTEAMADRFVFAEFMEEADEDQHSEIYRRLESITDKSFSPVTDLETVNRTRRLIYKNVRISEEVLYYCSRVNVAINQPRESGLFVEERKILGKGRLFRQATPVNPRTTAFLGNAAKTLAAINYRNFVTFDDVRSVMPAVLRTRLSLITEGAIYRLISEDGDSLYRSRREMVNSLTDQILEKVPVV